MTPRELLATARIPGGEEMKLYRRGGDHMILVERDELMSSRMSGSEEALAELSINRLRGRKAPHLLIGGYGMGFTLRKALELLPGDGRATVAELVPEILDWATGPMAAMTGDSLNDSRVDIRIGDVAPIIAEAGSTYDAILLDVDNGPDGLVRAENNRLYSIAGLAAARQALRPAGILAIWSASPDPSFTKRLSAARFHVDEEVVRARSNGKGPRHHIWFATPR